VGTTQRTWTDTERPEPFGPDPSAPRTLVAQVWYPAATDAPADGTRARQDPYLDDPEQTDALAELLGLPPLVLAGLARGTAHAFQDAAPAPGPFPVLVHLNGFGGGKGLSRAWVEDAASHGHVVIGLDQPGTAAFTRLPDGTGIRVIDKTSVLDPLMPLAVEADPDGERATPVRRDVMPDGIIPFLAQDASAALDLALDLTATDPLLSGRLDVERAGVFGISLGGYTAGEAARTDDRFRACLVADAGQREETASAGIDQPLLILTRNAAAIRREREQAGGWPESEVVHTVGTERALAENSRGPAWYVELNGLHHLNWTDAPLWSPLVQWRGMGGPMEPRQAIAAVRAGTNAFFAHALAGGVAGPVAGFAADYADTEVRTYRV
jgi:hypothetical protein